MYSEITTITGFFVDSDSGQLALSIPAADLYDAAKSSEVLLSWQTTDDYNNIITKFSRLVSASRSPLDVTEDVSYTFVFDNGETYANDGNVYAERTSGDTDVPADPQSEGGSGGGGVLVVTDIGGTLDKTWQEIHDAPFATLVMYGETVYVLDSRYESDGVYGVIFYNSTGSETREYHTASASGHPSTPNSEA